jgi:3-deoxy-D-manno-octulosonic-acid transferase
VVWVHAVSVGETHAIASVVRQLRQARPDAQLIISTTTHTGQETALKVFPDAEVHCFLPFDFRMSVRRALSNLTLAELLFSEGDVWPVFMDEAKKRGAHIAVVSGKISDRSYRRLMLCRVVSRWLYSFVDLYCVQDATYFSRLCELGVAERSLHITGSTKADSQVSLLSPAEKDSLCHSFGVTCEDRLVVLGSTHDPEEEELVRRLVVLEGVHVVVVPRHPERFVEVYRKLCHIEPATALLSTYDGVTPWRVMVVDRLGMLTKIYTIATVAIVCGSFTEDVGGHNILEPAAVGVPVVVGPYMHSQQTLWSSALNANAIAQVTYETVANVVSNLALHDDLWHQASAKALQWAQSLRGATTQTVQLLLENAVHWKMGPL